MLFSCTISRAGSAGKRKRAHRTRDEIEEACQGEKT